MDKVIHATLDKRDELKEQVKADLEKLHEGLSLNLILQNPQSFLEEYAAEAAQAMIGKYADQFINEGRKFASKVKAMKRPVEFKESEDPKENADQS